MDRGALLSDCGLYRYKLWRTWEHRLPQMIFVMLNPSTADGSVDDATIRKCIGFAERGFFGGITVVNLFAFRATKPADLKAAGWQRGPHNEIYVRAAVRGAAVGNSAVVCAWGANARGLAAAKEMVDLLRFLGVKPMALQLTPDGVPWHPLMLSYEVDGKPRELVEMPA